MAGQQRPVETGRAALDGLRQVSGWHEIYQELYRDAGSATFGENFAGWDSSYDGLPIPLEEMRHWRDATVERIRALRPRRVLEVGVGSGLLMSRIAPECEEYWGTDISETVIEALKRQLAEQRPGIAERVRLHAAPADRLEGIPAGYFDTIVVNSVVQYFPDVDYLTAVLTEAVLLLAPGGSVFVGDVRDLELLPRFHAAVAAERSADRGDTAAVRAAAARLSAQESELAIAPEYFAALPELLPELECVDVRLKSGPHRNELTRHRYDVVLRTSAAELDVTTAPRTDWSGERLDLVALPALLAAVDGPLRVTGVPNARLVADDDAWRALAGLGPQPDRTDAVEPDALVAVVEQSGRHCAITFSATDHTRFDAVLWPAGCNRPDLAVTGVHLPRQTAVDNTAPSFDDPSRYSGTPAALNQAAPDPAVAVATAARPVSGAATTPRTPYEETVRDLVAEVLALPRSAVGLDDHFFALGGHSLASARLVGRIRAVLGVSLGIRTVYDAPSVMLLAAMVQRLSGASRAAVAPSRPFPPSRSPFADPTAHHPGDASPGPRSADVEVTVDAAVHRRLAVLAREYGVTTRVAVHTALAVLLARMTGARDVPLGVALPGDGGRPATVTVRAGDALDFATLLGRVRSAHLDAAAEVCADRVGTEDDQRGLPFAALVFGCPARPADAARSPLTVELAEQWSENGHPMGLRGRVTFPAAGPVGSGSDAEPESDAKAFTARLARVLDAVTRSPGDPVDVLDLSLPGEQQRALARGRGPERAVPSTSVAAVLDMQALLTPQAAAVVSAGATLTHAELKDRSDRLARRLTLLGAGLGRVVAVQLPVSDDLVVAYAAVAKSGSICLPLTPGMPATVTSAAPAAVITDSRSAPLPWPDAPLLLVHEEGPATGPVAPSASRAADPVLATATEHGLVAIDAESVRTLSAWRFTTLPESAAAPRALLPDGTVDFGFLDILDALVSGATVQLPPTGVPDEEQARWLARHGCAELSGPAADVARICRAADRSGTDLSALKVIGTHGPDRASSELFADAGHRVRLEHAWWSGVRVTSVRLPGTDARPLWNQAVRILDRMLRPVPPGVVGELYLNEGGVGSSWCEHSALEADRYVPDPYGGAGTRMLRTGRTVRLDTSGGLPVAVPGEAGGSPVHPFDDPGAMYLVLRDPDARHCLWPAGHPVPERWTPVGPEDVLDAAREELLRLSPHPATPWPTVTASPALSASPAPSPAPAGSVLVAAAGGSR